VAGGSYVSGVYRNGSLDRRWRYLDRRLREVTG